MSVSFGGGVSRGGGSGLVLRDPPDIFTGANLAACITARNAYFTAAANAASLAEFQRDQFLAIMLDPAGADNSVWQTYAPGNDGAAYSAAAWLDRSSVTRGDRGPGPTDAQVTSAVQTGVKPYARTGGPQISGADADPAFVLEPELTQSFLLGIIGLTAAELNDLFLDAAVSGTGAGRVITITQADGSTISLAVPDTGGGGGGGSADGVVTSAAFSADGMTLTLGTSAGGTVTANVPSALRQSGLSQAQVQALIDAADADDLDAADVAAQITAQLAVYRQFAGVISRSADYEIQVADRGDTIRLTGAAARTFTAASGVPIGWWARLLNTSTADLTFSAGIAGRIEGAGSTLTVPAGDCVAVQYLGASTWAVITDTAGEAAGGDGGGEPARELEVLAAPEPIVATSGVTQQALPTGYDSYDNYEIIATTTGNVVTVLRGRAAWLAAQTDAAATKLGVLDQSEAGSRQWLTWTPSTRTFGRGGQNPGTELSARIVSVRLYDDGGAGGSGEIADNSIAPIKALAGTEAEKRAWRIRFDAANISIGTTLPPIAETGDDDIRIIPQEVASGLSFVDIADRATELNSADAGDVIMTIMFREKQWVRVGNIITGRGDATARAAIEALMLRVAANEQLASDIDRIVDGVSWANAPAAEAQFAAILASSALGRKVTRVDTTAIDPATDIPAATAWNTVLNPVPDDSAILIRVKTGLASIQFRMNNNGSVQPLFSFRSRVSDANWDYYDGGIVSGGASAIEKRTEAFHTAFHGELSGRALEQVEALAGGGADATARAAATAAQTAADANTAARWPGEAFVTPHEIPIDQDPFTMRAFLTSVAGSYPTGAKMRINASGRNGAWVTIASESPAELAFDATQTRNLVSNASGGLVGGLPRLHIADSDDTELAVIPLRIPLIPRGKWRTLTGSSPYTVLATDDEFEAALIRGTAGVNGRVLVGSIPRAALTQTAKFFAAAEANPTGNNREAIGVNAHLDSAGTSLTLVLAGIGGVGGDRLAQWSVEEVYAK